MELCGGYCPLYQAKPMQFLQKHCAAFIPRAKTNSRQTTRSSSGPSRGPSEAHWANPGKFISNTSLINIYTTI